MPYVQSCQKELNKHRPDPLVGHSQPKEYAMLVSLFAAIRNWALYRRTVRELSDLNARQLSELGIHKSDIRRVAREAVYGGATA
jgi:uncharacterized protein YjiS (DUF1127 family)